MSRSNVGGWLLGKTVRKGGAASANSGRSTPQIQSTSATIFGGGVKDASGRTAEYFVSSFVASVAFFFG
jgi:CDK-activating kinase assembly factor MAT1